MRAGAAAYQSLWHVDMESQSMAGQDKDPEAMVLAMARAMARADGNGETPAILREYLGDAPKVAIGFLEAITKAGWDAAELLQALRQTHG